MDSEKILGKFYRHLAIFFWSHCPPPWPLLFTPLPTLNNQYLNATNNAKLLGVQPSGTQLTRLLCTSLVFL